MNNVISIDLIDTNDGQIEGLPRNPRFIRDEKFEALKRSIVEDPEMLSFRPVMVYPFNGRYVAIGGNMRLTALKELGYTDVPCVVIPEGTDAKKLRAYTMKDNYGYGEWDSSILAEEWDMSELDEWGMDDIQGFDLSESVVEAGIANEDNFDENKAKERPVFAKTGDIWILGNHRLMCGDSTDQYCVSMLLDGNKADISFTSPPYGVSRVEHLRTHFKKGENARDKGIHFYDKHDDNAFDWSNLIEKSYNNMANNSVMQFINIQMLADNRISLSNFVNNHAEDLVDIIIWDKHHGAPQAQSNVLNNRFEFIYIFGGNGTRTITFGDFHGNVDNMIDDVGKEQNQFADVHRAVFPIALPKKILSINSKAKTVLDLFGGTGTTLIAAEEMGVSSFLMELSEQYVSIIINRYVETTGKDDVFLISDGNKIPLKEVIEMRNGN